MAKDTLEYLPLQVQYYLSLYETWQHSAGFDFLIKDSSICGKHCSAHCLICVQNGCYCLKSLVI